MTESGGNGPMARALAEVVAKQQITEVIYRYCRGLDRMDRALALSIWRDGAMVDYGAFFQGKCTDFIDRAWAFHETLLSHSHQVSNILIELDGNRAVSESYFTAALRSRGDHGSTIQFTSRGRYLDEWSCLDGAWAIDRRVSVHDFSDSRVVTDTEFPSSARRDEGDLSFQFFSKNFVFS